MSSEVLLDGIVLPLRPRHPPAEAAAGPEEVRGVIDGDFRGGALRIEVHLGRADGSHVRAHRWEHGTEGGNGLVFGAQLTAEEATDAPVAGGDEHGDAAQCHLHPLVALAPHIVLIGAELVDGVRDGDDVGNVVDAAHGRTRVALEGRVGGVEGRIVAAVVCAEGAVDGVEEVVREPLVDGVRDARHLEDRDVLRPRDRPGHLNVE